MTSAYPALENALAAMESQSELYRPSSFWKEASTSLASEFIEQGIENFRSLDTALGYFVPTYGVPGNSYTKPQVESIIAFTSKIDGIEKKSLASLELFLSGHMHALSDYRTFCAADDIEKQPYLHRFSESNAGNPIEQFEFDNRRFSRSSMNYLLGLALLKKHLKSTPPKIVLEIGGGFGTLGEILSSSGISGARYIDIDIPPVSFAAEYYLEQVLGRENVAGFSETSDLPEIQIDHLPYASVLCSWQIEKLVGKIDLFVNFISFQEMEPGIVKNYITSISRLEPEWLLLRNLREGKQKKTSKNDTGVITPIKTSDYLDMLEEFDLIEQNVMPFGYKTIDNFHSELLLLKRKL